MNPLFVIYHGGCDDGFASAWAVRNHCEETGNTAEYYPGVYQNAPPDVSGRDVVMVDFSYKRPVIQEMAKTAKSILILDHHKTAAEDLLGFPAVESLEDFLKKLEAYDGDGAPVFSLFDMERSGAGISWDFFNPGRARPRFINYIEDRDLWRRKLPSVDLFTIALRSYPQDFDVWDDLVAGFQDKPEVAFNEAIGIERYYRLQVETLKKNAYECCIGSKSWFGLAVNCPYAFASEVAGELADDEHVGVCFFQLKDGRWQYSLRSRGSQDVSAIALEYGGGGHAKAAGFTVPEPVHIR